MFQTSTVLQQMKYTVLVERLGDYKHNDINISGNNQTVMRFKISILRRFIVIFLNTLFRFALFEMYYIIHRWYVCVGGIFYFT